MTDPINALNFWLSNLLTGYGLPQTTVVAVVSAVGILLLCTILLVIAIAMVWVERKVVGRFQDRLGPNRVGPWGIFQPFADILKLLIKEDTTPQGADRFVYNLPPIIALATVLLFWGVIPLMPTLVGSDINVGIIYIVAVGAIGTLGIIMAGWASNNKYALLGALRTVAQMVSYEVPMVVILLVPVILAKSMGVQDIVLAQMPYNWFIFLAPVAAVIFLITSIAEIGRAPFDLTEAESEIVAGFHIEYSGMKFGMFYAGELLHALTIGALFSTFFLGGWRGPYVDQWPFLGVFYLLIKAFFVYFVIMWIKYSLPRIRIDHMLNFNWKFLTPLAIAVVFMLAIVDKVLQQYFPNSPGWVYVALMLITNLLVGWVALVLVRRFVQIQRNQVSSPRPIARPENPPAESGASGD